MALEVKANPQLNIAALKRRKDLELTTWYLARALSSSGRISYEDLEASGVKYSIFTPRRLKQVLHDKTLFDVYVSPNGVRMIRFLGLEALCRAWGILPMAKPQMIPISQFSGVLSRRRALYQGSLPTDKSRPISRLSQESKYGRSERTLQRYSQDVIVDTNWNTTNIHLEGKPVYKSLSQPRMPNTYRSHYREAKRGMLRRVYKALRPLDSKGRGENRERLYYPSIKAYLKNNKKNNPGTCAFIRLAESILPSSGNTWEYVYQNCHSY